MGDGKWEDYYYKCSKNNNNVFFLTNFTQKCNSVLNDETKHQLTFLAWKKEALKYDRHLLLSFIAPQMC